MATPRTTPLSAQEEAFLRALARSMTALPRALEADLVAEEGLTTSEYFALMHLSEAPDRTLRMGDLAAASALSLSGMTRVVQRLERQGWVRRERSCQDGRGSNAVLTAEGLRRLRRAWPTHLASVRRRVFEHLEGLDLAEVTRAFEQLGDDASGPES